MECERFHSDGGETNSQTVYKKLIECSLTNLWIYDIIYIEIRDISKILKGCVYMKIEYDKFKKWVADKYAEYYDARENGNCIGNHSFGSRTYTVKSKDGTKVGTTDFMLFNEPDRFVGFAIAYAKMLGETIPFIEWD